MPVIAKNGTVQSWEVHPCQYQTQVLPVPKKQGGQVRIVAHPHPHAPPFLSILTPAPRVAPAPPTSFYFGTGILETLPYANLPQAPYPPPTISEADDLTSTVRTTADDVCQASSLQVFLASVVRRG